MKLMIASDIHGSSYYCRKMIEAYQQEKADRLLLLGDLLYHGPRNDLPRDYNPKEVISMLNEIKNELLCVRAIAILRLTRWFLIFLSWQNIACWNLTGTPSLPPTVTILTPTIFLC